MTTIFKNFNEVIEHKPIHLVLEEIKKGKYKKEISQLRILLSENKSISYDNSKKNLPAFTPSGKFVGGRKFEHLTDYSNTIILDIDKLNPNQLAKASSLANQCMFTLASFVSPSGNGLKILVKVKSNVEHHKQTFLLVQDYYEKLLSLQIDKSGKDVTRLCFYSFDENLYFNPNSSFFPIKNQIDEYRQRGFTYLKDEETTYKECVKFTEKKVQFVNGSRNIFVYQLACNLNRKGVEKEYAMSYILQDYGYNEWEVIQTINSAYAYNQGPEVSNQLTNTNKEIYNSKTESLVEQHKSEITQIDRLETFLSKRYEFRYNAVLGKLEYKIINKSKWNAINDFIENSILRECLKGGIRINLTSLRNLLHSDFSPLYNPFEDYFGNLPMYDGKEDYINHLANTITTTKQELWRHCFKKWLVAMVGCLLDDNVINHTVIVFSGKQGIGKTTWLEKLVPNPLKHYLYSGSINPNNKDTLIHLSECMLINLDELENLNRSEIGSLKEIITKTQIRMRKAYGHNNETMPRRASFAGSVNTAQFLNDSTGSRRFLCFEVEHIQYQHEVDINLVYAQAMSLFKSGFRFWFDQEEIKSITANNEQYQLHSPEEELLLTWFEPCERENATAFLNASQIAAKLAERTKLNLNDSTINKLGKALKKHNFTRLKKEGIYVYAMLEKTYEEVDNNNKVV